MLITKVSELPLDSHLVVFILLLLMNKHVMVEKLLELLVGEVDADQAAQKCSTVAIVTGRTE